MCVHETWSDNVTVGVDAPAGTPALGQVCVGSNLGDPVPHDRHRCPVAHGLGRSEVEKPAAAHQQIATPAENPYGVAHDSGFMNDQRPPSLSRALYSR